MAAITIPTSSQAAAEPKSADVKLTVGKVNATNALTAGNAVYLNTSGEWDLADADDTDITAGERGLGVAITNGAVGSFVIVVTGGTITFGGTPFTQGLQYIVGDTPGALNPSADFAGFSTGDRLSLVATAITSSQLRVSPQPLLATKP